jgi:hypothetical protein
MIVTIEGISTVQIFIPTPMHYELFDILMQEDMQSIFKGRAEQVGVNQFAEECLMVGLTCCKKHSLVFAETCFYLVGKQIDDRTTYCYEQKKLS